MELGKYSTEKRADEIGCTTLVHGDMWTNNMLIKANEDGSISNEILAIIDWQTTFKGEYS
jgi:aminoglycoside phosphotransferase (APT) family kinase protein